MLRLIWRPGSRRAVAALALCVASAGPAAGSADRPPVELYNPAPQAPPEVVAAGIDPEVTVELRIDARGRVERVEIVKIEPSTEWDALVGEAMRATLATWRYAPRHEAGTPVGARLMWTMEFSSVADATGRPTDRSWWEVLLPRRLGERTDSLLTLPEQQRLKLLEHEVAQGLRFLGGSVEHGSPRFTVRTDTTTENAAVIANNLEAAYHALDRMIGETVPTQPEKYKVQTIVFKERQAYAFFYSSSRPTESVGDGFYSHLGLISFHLQLASPRHALEMVLHEATHAYMDRHVIRPGVTWPHWLNEGLAEYLANSKIEKGALVPGRQPRRLRQYLWFRQGKLQVLRDKSGAAAALEEIKRAAKRGEALRLEEMLDADRDEFYGERLRLYYGMSWLAVHFLRHGREDWQEGAFPVFLLYAAEGYPISASLEAAYGTPPSELDGEFQQYLASF